MISKVTGFIVSTVAFRDTSLILNILTKEYGLIGVMAKGVKSMKNRLRALTQQFTYGSFYIYYKEDKLSVLKDVDIIDSLLFLHNDIMAIGYLSYVSELATQVYKESEESHLFDLLINIILKMNEGFDPEVLAHIFEMKCLTFLGVEILINECARCGSTKNIVTIDGDAGGLICRNCYRGERVVSIKSLKLLRMYASIDVKSITKLQIAEENKKEIDLFLSIYYHRYTGLYLKSKDFLHKLKESMLG